jgi:fibronectin-binding autotransporter adhesin
MPAQQMSISGDFSLSGTASVTAAQNILVNGNVTIGSNTIFNASSYSHTIAGNWSNSGTFTGATSTITFNGVLAQTLTGTTTFNNLTINSAGVTICQRI